ncbi:MAG: DUF1554 domain-containing protein [Leptospira sp.]|nr:DUF1554 domain-containing protein [Leptospira sp.]
MSILSTVGCLSDTETRPSNDIEALYKCQMDASKSACEKQNPLWLFLLNQQHAATATGEQDTNTVATPTFDPPAGTFASDQEVSIATTTEGATIHYTTDGSDPTTESNKFGSAISVAGEGTTMTIKAIAVKDGMTNSSIAAGDYTINNPKRIFVSATRYTGDLGGISGADAKCAGDTNKPTTGTYKAFIVDGAGTRRACTTANCSGGTGEHIDWVLKPNTSYVRAVGTTALFVTNSNGIFTDDLSNGISPDTTTYIYWTGLNTDFTSAAAHCVNWGNGTGTAIGRRGDGSSVAKSSAISSGIVECDEAGMLAQPRLVCVEQ